MRQATTFVVSLKVLHILQYERLRLVMFDNFSGIEEECPLRCVQKSMWSAERILFRDTGDGEGLAGKSSQ